VGNKGKTILVILCVFFIFIINSCKTAPGTVVPDNGDGAVQVGSNIATVTEGQTDLAVTGTNIENIGDGITSGIENIESAIITGEDGYKDLAAILRAIRARPDKTFVRKTDGS
jgi:hypothetical protein